MKTKQLQTGKCTGTELDWLLSIGWKVIDGWTVKGEEEIEVECPDRYSTYITDPRFLEFKKKRFDEMSVDN